MRIEDLHSFRVAAEQGNLHRAAAVLGVTQSALSKMLSRLEREVGDAVFERTATGVVLTAAGAIVLQHARTVHSALHDMDDALRDHRGAQSGMVRVGCLPMLMSTLISPVLARFFINRPLATFSIEEHLSARLLDLLTRGQIDLAVAAIPPTFAPQHIERLSSSPLGVLRMQIVTRTEHPRLHRFKGIADLDGERWAMPATAHYLRDWLEARFTSVGLPAPRLAVESTASPVAFAELLRASDLLSIMPPHILRQPAGSGLTAIAGHDTTWQHDFAVFWREDGYMSPLCADFRDALSAYCVQDPVFGAHG